MNKPNSPIKTRFAPSPTGLMHFGNLRTALFNFLYAKRYNGTFLLRVEDTDQERSTKEFEEAILRDMEWMGIIPYEGPYYQSKRGTIYDNYYHELQEKDFLYPCFCTEAQLSLIRKVQMQSGKPPRYPGTCAQLSKEEVTQKIKEGIPYTLRFRIPKNEIIEFEDLIKGPQKFDTDHIGDFIVRRGSGGASFMFCNAIDDALMGVTHALRGDDHLTNTPRQILILKTLKLNIPNYGHFPTILGPDGKPLSKRNGSRSIQELREEGFHPLAIVNYLARLGHTDSEQSLDSLEKLGSRFDLNRISQSPARYDEQQLFYWQKEAIRKESWETFWQKVKDQKIDWFIGKKSFAELIPTNKQKSFVETVQPNILFPKEAEYWVKAFFSDKLEFNEEDKKIIQEAGPAFFEAAQSLLSSFNQSEQNDEMPSNFVSELQQKSGLKGKAFFMPLRLVLTGKKEGPELPKMLSLMGRNKVYNRFHVLFEQLKKEETKVMAGRG